MSLTHRPCVRRAGVTFETLRRRVIVVEREFYFWSDSEIRRVVGLRATNRCRKHPPGVVVESLGRGRARVVSVQCRVGAIMNRYGPKRAGR